MSFHLLPKEQGLYSPRDEHDACGIGLYVNLKGKKTHEIVEKGLEMLCRLDHRAGRGSDGKTGDGSGLMVQIPHDFFRQEITAFQLPVEGMYGVGMLFFSQDDAKGQQVIEEQMKKYAEAEGQTVLGFRTVPVDASTLSDTAKKTAPVVRQLFIQANPQTVNLAFERKLYLIRKQTERFAKAKNISFYCASLSSKTMVFKGLLAPEEVAVFYKDLQQPHFTSAFSMVHSRYSTNTFPSWERAHPNRYLIHNGEINTLQGNVNWMKAREQQFISDAFGDDLQKVLPIIDESGSDSSMLDNAFEFFVLAGRTPAQTAMMMIPEPWTENPHISKEKKAFYNYHSTLMEPWDGPTAICFTDGKQIGAILDRNGLRPARYYVTKDDYMIFSSEVGVVDVKEEDVLYKERLSPGKMLLIDLEEGRVIADDELKHQMATEKPYGQWLDESLVKLTALEDEVQINEIRLRQKIHGYTYENTKKYLLPVLQEGKDPIGSMGNDAPLAVLSERPQSLFHYFKQLFAQVTNPPIDSIREHIVTSTMTLLGKEGDLLHPSENNSRRIQLDSPILTPGEWLALQKQNQFRIATISLEMTEDLEKILKNLAKQVDEAIQDGAEIIVLSDDLHTITPTVPILLAASSVHHHLIRTGRRTRVSIVVQSLEVREVHHFATLIGYGVDAIYPSLAYATVEELVHTEKLSQTLSEAFACYRKAMTDGIVKVMAKMGISTVQSYRGAQIFEAVGIHTDVIAQYFTGTKSQMSGIDLATIQLEAEKRFHEAVEANSLLLESGSEYQWRSGGEHHAFNPKTIHTLQWAVRKNDAGLYYQYAEMANEEQIGFLRHLFTFKENLQSIPLEEVESAQSIVKRFKTGAMSYGSISEEAHEALAIAMNQIGGRSNSGEGGESPERFEVDEKGQLRRSAIKQIASGRFGVSSHYLVNADELQIKMAQGAKPGEGGQLPGNKVYPWVAKVRGATPGVGLISPPPHHDIYSIEDMAELIHDLKNANREASISVKLVAKTGVGTIAAGVAKGAADKIVISGYDGGTGASPKTSIQHTGLPWELGLAEAHQTLMLNHLRERVTLETDGKLMTGKDVILAALLGAEEFGFATAPLIALGCVMMRACHLDTCPVGVATQNPALREKFMGKPEHVVNFMYFIAEDVRLWMSKLGFRTFDEMVGRTDILEQGKKGQEHWKARHLDLSKLLVQVEGPRTKQVEQNHHLDQSLDMRSLFRQVDYAIQTKTAIQVTSPIRNVDRVVGTIVGSEISKRYGAKGLPDQLIQLHFKGSAGQSFGAFMPKGMLMTVEGDANDYFAKGLSGGTAAVISPLKGQAEENVVAGNVCLYGATGGQALINGRAGERFAVRNSGADIVVEGIGDHGCEYMTGGHVVILGDVGKNFAAGMSGGVVYICPTNREEFEKACNKEMIRIADVLTKKDETNLHHLIEQHYLITESTKAQDILNHFEEKKKAFIKVIPEQYEMMLQEIQTFEDEGLNKEEAAMQAFMSATK